MTELDGNVAAGVAATANGVASDGSIEWTLPSGKVARMRPGKGRDIKRASQMVDPQKDGWMGLSMALAAVKTLIDGKPITYEDLLDFDEADVFALVNSGTSGKGLSPPIISPA